MPIMQTLIDAIRRGDVSTINKTITKLSEDERKLEALETALKRCSGLEGSKFWKCTADFYDEEVKKPSRPIELKFTPEGES